MTQIHDGLFSALAAQLRQYCSQIEAQLERNLLSFPASEIDNFGHGLFSNLEKGGYCTLVVTGRATWDPKSHYYEAARFAARRGCNIERAFLLPHNQCKHDRCFQEHKKLDEDAGITTKAYYVGELISSLALPNSDSLDFGVWDDKICCSGTYGKGGPNFGITEWIVSKRNEDVQLFKDLYKTLKEKAPIVSVTEEDDENLNLEEPMITTAPLTYELAPVLCQGDHVSPEDCSWYHSIWQYLRIFDMVSTPTWHEDFYLKTFAKLSQAGHHNILITGTADYSVLSHVLWAYQDFKRDVDVSVVDLCETPLFLCKWYAKLSGFRVNTFATDLLSFEPSNQPDLITTDAFLTRFSPKDRLNIIQKWYDLLSPGGKIVTTVRVEPGLTDESVGSTEEQIRAFKNKAKQEAKRWQGFLAHSIDDIANGAEKYAQRMRSYSIPSEDAVKDLFLDVGFDIDRFDCVNVRGEMKTTIYTEVVATKN